MIQLFRFFYNFLWCLVVPFLFVFTRHKYGFRQRLGFSIPSGPYDIWIQSASGGESYLSLELLDEIAQQSSAKDMRLLLSAGTPQGVGILEQRLKGLDLPFDVDVVYFPLDAPLIMKRVFQKWSPKQLVIVETELWPSLLIEAKRSGVPVHLVNARMSEKSYRSYLKVRRFLNQYGPDVIYAISEADFDRFLDVCPGSQVHLMNNIKFDRLKIEGEKKREDFKDLFPLHSKIIVLGSVRRQEEAQIIQLIQKLNSFEDSLSVALFPKHEMRAKELCKKLRSKGINAKLRSSLEKPAEVVVWDTFGELTDAYYQADAVFVGGTLEKLGGQNFLEPLTAGIRPIIGPHYHNFLWVGEEVFEMGLVTKVHNSEELYEELQRTLNTPGTEDFSCKVEEYLQKKQGGAVFVVAKILQTHKPST